MAYSDAVVKRFEAVLDNPGKHSVGSLDRKDPKVATGLAGAPAWGDVMQLQLKLDEDDRIIDVKFKTYGCGSAIASSSLFVDLMMGKTVEEAKLIKDKDIADALELPPIKLHCSVLAEDAIKQAMIDYETKQTEDYAHPILDQPQTMIGHNNPPLEREDFIE
jgi:nitrogen fixation NifU-like protein